MKRLLVILLALAVLVELVLRIPPVEAAVDRAFPPPPPIDQEIREQGQGNDHAFIRDPELGNRPVPSRRVPVRTIDFEFMLELDSAGFPNRGPWPERADIALLGNSLLVGQGVGIDSQFSTLLAHRLGTSRVVNFGLGGAAPEHQYRIYRRYAAAMHPRLVLAFLWVASDVTNAYNFARWLAHGNGQDFYQYRTSGGAKVRRGLLARLGGAIQRRSRLIGTIGAALRGGRRRAEPYLKLVPFPTGDTLYLSQRTQPALAAGMHRRGLPRLKQVFFDPLVRLRDEVEADDGHLVVVLIPSKEELYGAQAFPPALDALKEVRAGLDSLDLTTIDLYPVVRNGAGQASPFFERDIHFNALGNRLVADGLAQWITAHPDQWEPARVPEK